MGMFIGKKRDNPKKVKLMEHGPWWMKYYENGRPYYASTETFDKNRGAQAY